MRPPSALLAALVLAGGLHAVAWARWNGPENRGARLLAQGRGEDAIAVLAAAEEAGGARLRYHLGVALLESGRPGDAARAFEGALATAGDPELRYRTLHNLALARLRLAASSGPASLVQARAAVAAAQEALRLWPEADDTRRTLMLASDRMGVAASQPDERADADGGPAGAAGSAGAGGADRPMTAAEALRLLDALGTAEGVRIRLPLSERTGTGR